MSPSISMLLLHHFLASIFLDHLDYQTRTGFLTLSTTTQSKGGWGSAEDGYSVPRPNPHFKDRKFHQQHSNVIHQLLPVLSIRGCQSFPIRDRGQSDHIWLFHSQMTIFIGYFRAKLLFLGKTGKRLKPWPLAYVASNGQFENILAIFDFDIFIWSP